MPKHLALLVAVSALALCSCTSLSHLEQREYKSLEHQGISLKHPVGDYKPPNNAILAGALNILPGFGNFYLALGHGSDGVHAVYGLVNLLFWPISIGRPGSRLRCHPAEKKRHDLLLPIFSRWEKGP